MKQDFSERFEYNNHMNQKLIGQILQQLENIPEKTISLINHLINAHQIWNARIVGNSQFEVWQINDSEKIAGIDNENYSATLAIIEKRKLDETINYSNSQGAQFSNNINDILFHIINHSTYHRAQIATDLKQHGMEAVNTDYIFYKRKSAD